MDESRIAVAALKRDKRLAVLIAKVGPPRFHEYSRRSVFTNLLEAILAQQLSAGVARVIFERFRKQQGKGFPDAEHILSTQETTLRGLGFSRAKVVCVHALSRMVRDAELDLNALDALPDDKVVGELIRVKGIGPWTAHMTLIFALKRPDVWPVADLGLRKSLQALLELPSLPTPSETRSLGERWRPYRSYACWYLWQLNDL